MLFIFFKCGKTNSRTNNYLCKMQYRFDFFLDGKDSEWQPWSERCACSKKSSPPVRDELTRGSGQLPSDLLVQPGEALCFLCNLWVVGAVAAIAGDDAGANQDSDDSDDDA